MRKSLYAAKEINAPKQKVWQALIEKHKWKYWNTFLFDCDPNQQFIQGQKAFLSMRRLPGDEETEFQPYITFLEPGVGMRWIFKFPGFVNEYSFELQEIGIRRTKYIHNARFSGLFSPTFLIFSRANEQAGVRRMARELKYYLEYT